MGGAQRVLQVDRQGAGAVRQLELAGTYLTSIMKDDRL